MNPKILIEKTHDTFLKLRPESRIDIIDLIDIRFTGVKNNKLQREFTALITAINPDKIFQECWTFELEPNGWQLKKIEQPRELPKKGKS